MLWASCCQCFPASSQEVDAGGLLRSLFVQRQPQNVGRENVKLLWPFLDILVFLHRRIEFKQGFLGHRSQTLSSRASYCLSPQAPPANQLVFLHRAQGQEQDRVRVATAPKHSRAQPREVVGIQTMHIAMHRRNHFGTPTQSCWWMCLRHSSVVQTGLSQHPSGLT